MTEVTVVTLAPTVFNEVSAMNTAFNNPFGGATLARLTKQCNAIPEEITELHDAHVTLHEIGVRDAACDILVFSLGALHLMGLDYNELKGEEFPRTLYAHNGGQDPVLDIINKLNDDLYPNLVEALELEADLRTSLSEITKALLAIIDAAFGVYTVFGFGEVASADMHAVYVSNMSKFCATQEDLDSTVKKYEDMGLKVRSEGEFPTMCVKSDIDQDQYELGEDGQPDESSGELVVIAHFPAGKFLKGVNYQAPVFA